MPPKKSSTAAKPKAAGVAPSHGSYIDMVKDAIVNLKDRNGSSRQAIQKYIQANNKLNNATETQFRTHVNRAIASGREKGDFSQPKGTSGPVKLAKKEAKPAAAAKKTETKAKTETKTETETETEEKPASKKATTTKTKAITAKKAAPKKAATTKVAPKKAAATTTKPKANASKPRKTAAATAAPAVDKEDSPVLGKTKSGRVTKTKAPVAPKATKQGAPKKAVTPKKAVAAKKSTPKKATPKNA